MPMDTYGSINGGSSSDRAKLMPTKSRPDEPEACDDGVGDRGLGLLAQSRFEGNLRKVGVQMEEETSTSEKKKIHFIKLFVPWDVMCYYAEDLCLRAPLQVRL
uniref:Anoct_dimer domain-containing protein n=1 Tax=Macrostomum lignano TaxID=282301 RepID=A0A1I8F3B5_9PLAT